MDVEAMLAYNKQIVSEFRTNGGKVGAIDSPLVVLTTAGSRTGEPRTSPMVYLQDEQNSDRIYVFASFGGRDENPAWFGNLVAHPHDVVVELLGESLLADAHVLPEAERTPIFTEQARRQPQFADYQAKTSRIIPVVALDLRR